jgi:hypothetical protein
MERRFGGLDAAGQLGLPAGEYLLVRLHPQRSSMVRCSAR